MIALGSIVHSHNFAEAHAALQRVAALVSRGVSRDALLAAVSEEIAWLVGADRATILPVERDDGVTDAVLRAVRESDGAVRFGPAELRQAGPFVEAARRGGIRTSVGVPITVDGRVWGVALAAWSRPGAVPEAAEATLGEFMELVATAIAQAQTRAELRRLAETRAALRRVAELIARDVEPDVLFGAVAREASRLLGDRSTALLRYEEDGGATVVAVRGGPATVGMRVPADGNGIAARVLRTGRPARLDTYAAVPGSAPVIAQGIGLGAAAGAPIPGDDRPWGLIGAMTSGEPLPAGTEDRLAEFGDLVALGIANVETRAKLTASRARVLTTADATRRRIQRDLHDGAQQRLIHTVVTLRLVRGTLGDDGSRQAALVDEALRNAELATTELSELVRGILPAPLTQGGLRAGIESLSRHVDLPVHVHVTPERLPAPVETTAYFLVAEALTNAVKHAHATMAHVRAAVADGVLQLEVRDDGAGGADPARGTGLVGLGDRVAACGGSMTITSAPGAGTTLSAELPIPPILPERKVHP